MNEKLEKDIRLLARARTVGKPDVSYDIRHMKTVMVDTGKLDQGGMPVLLPEKRFKHTVTEGTTVGEIKRIKRKIKSGEMRASTIRKLSAALRDRQRVAA